MPPTPRRTSQRVSTSPGCRPLYDMYLAAEQSKPRRWTEVEPDFLSAMWEFDRNFAAGRANQGDNQNGKGDFFTDLIALLLESSTGQALYGRGKVPGLIFEQHMLDASFPAEGNVELVIETKAAGAPKSDRNPRQKDPHGRPGSSDLKKRVTEAGLKTIDLKAEAARLAGEGQGPASDLLSWLKRSKPLCFLFLSIRVVGDKDLQNTLKYARAAGQIMDGVGLVAYRPAADGHGYDLCPVGPELELDRVLARVSTALRHLGS